MGSDIFLDDDLANVSLDGVKSHKLRKTYQSDIDRKSVGGKIARADKEAFKKWADKENIAMGQAIRALVSLLLEDEELRDRVLSWLREERLRKQIAHLSSEERSALRHILAENGTR